MATIIRYKPVLLPLIMIFYSFAVILLWKEADYFVNIPAVQTGTSCSFDCFRLRVQDLFSLPVFEGLFPFKAVLVLLDSGTTLQKVSFQ